jgi:uncharacterized protein with ATP-grasp and redox domains
MATKKLELEQQHKNLSEKATVHPKILSNKIVTENAMITQAGKGKTILIIHMMVTQKTYTLFLLKTISTTSRITPSTRTKSESKKTLQQCDLIINKGKSNTLYKNPSPPALKALLKLLKPGISIRPINNRNDPSYKITKN